MIITGDLNTHSQKWNAPGDYRSRDHHFLEDIAEEFELIIANDRSIMRRQHGGGQNALLGVIDLTLLMPSIACRVTEWKTLEEEDVSATSSDHDIIVRKGQWTMSTWCEGGH